jgi:REP element-mobilizing transposase RayT
MAPIFRKHPRLRDRDYTRGAYFVTLCATRPGDIFGRIVGTGTNAQIELNDAGLIVLDRWNAIPEHHPGTRLDQLQIMPDHLHAILVLDPPAGMASVGSTLGVDATGAFDNRRARPKGPAPGSLGAIIAAFKSVTTKRINSIRGRTGATVWQDGYHERAIRRQGGEYGRIAQYIAENPANWR